MVPRGGAAASGCRGARRTSDFGGRRSKRAPARRRSWRTRRNRCRPGALVAGLTGENLRDRAAVAGALGRVLDKVGRPRRIGLIVPDPVAKVSLVRFEQVPVGPARSRTGDPLAGAQERAVPDRVGAGQLLRGRADSRRAGVRRQPGPPGSHPRVRRPLRHGRHPGGHRRPLDVQCRERGAGVRSGHGGLAARQRGRGLRLDGHPPRRRI